MRCRLEGRRSRAAPRPYRAARSARSFEPINALLEVLPSERITVASAPAAISIDARSSGRGAMTRRLHAVCTQAEIVDTDEARVAAYHQLRQMLSWLHYPLERPEVYDLE